MDGAPTEEEESDPVEAGEEGPARPGEEGPAEAQTEAGPEADTAAESDGSGCEEDTAEVPAAPSTSSRHSAQTSGFITIPAPPPAGVSSTDRCTSWAQSRRSNTCIRTIPLACAFPSRLSCIESKYSGKTEIMLISILFPAKLCHTS